MELAASAEDRVLPGRSAPEGRAGEESSARSLRPRLPVAMLALVIALGTLITYPLGARGATAAFMAGVLVVLADIDLRLRIIPNRIVLPATAIILIARIATSPSHAGEYVIAAVGAAMILLLPNLVNSAAIGMGDVKLGLLLGAGLGRGVVGALMVGFISAFPFALGALIRGGRQAGKSTLPLGPFLAFGGLAILIVPQLVS